MLFVINMNSYVPDFQLLPQILQLNYKFTKLALSPQRMILLVKIILRIVEKSFFTRKRTCFSVISFKSRPALKLLLQYGCLNTCVPQKVFLFMY